MEVAAITPLTEYVPHREELPRRYCDCGVLPSSANATSKCSGCGGWIELLAFNAKAPGEDMAELMAQV